MLKQTGIVIRNKNMQDTRIKTVSWITVIFFGLYIVTDALEIFQSGLSQLQLVLTYIAMAGIPFSVMGLYILDEESGGKLYLSGSILISLSFIYFSGTATYGLAEQSTDYGMLIERLGFIYYAHGVVLVAGGLLSGAALYSRGIAHPAIGISLILASLLSLATGLFHLPELLFVIANFVRNGTFVALGLFKLFSHKENVIKPAGIYAYGKL